MFAGRRGLVVGREVKRLFGTSVLLERIRAYEMDSVTLRQFRVLKKNLTDPAFEEERVAQQSKVRWLRRRGSSSARACGLWERFGSVTLWAESREQRGFGQS